MPDLNLTLRRNYVYTVSMEIPFIKILTIAYGLTAIFDFIAYLPTYRDLIKHKKPSANVASFTLWACTTGIAFLYSIFVLPDLTFRIVSGAMFFSNLLVIVLSLRLRRS